MKLYSNITVIFIIWILAVLFIAFSVFNLLPHSDRFQNNFLTSFSNWDGGHYLGIAEFGYSEKFQYAFFPLYPLLIKLLTEITQNYLLSGILISIICTFLGLHIFYKLVSLDFDKRLAEKACIYLLFFPTAFYFLTVYTEGLFFFLTISTFYFLREKKLLLATIFAIFASATKVAGLAVVIALIVEVHLLFGISKKNFYIFLSPLGFILYCYFLNTQTGDPFYFITAQNHWLRSLSMPFTPFWETIRNLSSPGFTSTNYTAFLDLLFAIFGVGLIIRSFRFLPFSYSIYGLVSLALPLFSTSLSSMPRFLLVIFPIFILLSLLKDKYLILGYQMISLMLLGLFVALYIN